MNKVQPQNWQSAASIILDVSYDLMNSHSHYAMPDQEACLDFVISGFDDIVQNVFHDSADEEILEEEFLDLAIAGIVGLSHAANISHKEAINLIFDTLINKQKMYGHGNIARFALPGIVIRLNDKIERLKNLKQHKGPVLFEPINDTWLDITGYSVIAVMWMRDWFLLEMKAPKETTSQI
jgi:hypothetical protein